MIESSLTLRYGHWAQRFLLSASRPATAADAQFANSAPFAAQEAPPSPAPLHSASAACSAAHLPMTNDLAVLRSRSQPRYAFTATMQWPLPVRATPSRQRCSCFRGALQSGTPGIPSHVVLGEGGRWPKPIGHAPLIRGGEEARAADTSSGLRASERKLKKFNFSIKLIIFRLN